MKPAQFRQLDIIIWYFLRLIRPVGAKFLHSGGLLRLCLSIAKVFTQPVIPRMYGILRFCLAFRLNIALFMQGYNLYIEYIDL